MFKKEGKKKPELKDLHEEIRTQAEIIYRQRVKDNTAGSELTDWQEAEKLVKRLHGIK
jgi:hypothetical protein